MSCPIPFLFIKNSTAGRNTVGVMESMNQWPGISLTGILEKGIGTNESRSADTMLDMPSFIEVVPTPIAAS